MTAVHGVDISNRQADVDFQAMAANGVRFVWAKASEGYSYHDPYFAQNAARARAAGIPFGAYHFARPASSAAVLQAQWFRVVAALYDLPAMLDAEDSWLADRLDNTRWCLDWFDSIAEPRRVLYTNRDGLDHHLVPAMLVDAGVDLFLALPGDPGALGSSYARVEIKIVQYGQGSVPGVAEPVDLDVIDAATLELYTAPPTPPQEDDDVPGVMIRTTDDGGTIVVLPGNGAKPWIAHDPAALAVLIDAHLLNPNTLDEPDADKAKALRAAATP